MTSKAAVQTANGPNRGDGAEEETTAQSPPLRLSQFVSGLTPGQEFQRTAEYARDAGTYLRNFLGNDIFDKRKDLLCIPQQVDKDIYGTGEHKTHFQQHIAKLFGKAHGLFFITGVQAQLAALKVHCQRAHNNRVAWHSSCHLEIAEQKAYDVLYGLERRFLGSSDDDNPSIEEIKEVLALPADQRPAVIMLEIPNRKLGCTTYSFAELQSISSACKEAGVIIHCDGARIWEIEPLYQETAGKTFADVAHLFDSIYVSFYKGLRGASGAMLLCDDESLISEAKKWQRRAGGNAFTLAYEVIDCERGYNENIGSFLEKWKKMKDISDGVLASTAQFKTGNKQVISFMPERPTCCQTRTLFQGYTADELFAARDRVVERMNVQIFQRLFPKMSPDEQSETSKPGENASSESTAREEDDRLHVVEWMIVLALLDVETKVFVDAYVGFCEELQAGSQRP